MRNASQRPPSGEVIAGPSVAVLIPCFNEAKAIAKVVADFRAALPDARIYVYDNNSTDETARIAAEAGAIVRKEPLQGKGFVVRRMFADVDADIYLLVDGDDTYAAAAAPVLVARLRDEQLDMVNAARVADAKAAFRSGHRFGNWMLTFLVRRLFGDRIQDLLSGYRVFSRRYAKSFPALSGGFEIETELTVHALQLEMAIAEVNTVYKERAAGTVSKLRTYRDGFRILGTIFNLLRDERPLPFFTFVAFLLAATSIALSIPIFHTYAQIGLVPRFPTAILSTGLMLLAFLSFTSGLVLDSLARTRKQLKRLSYLAIETASRER
jgi:glycosyltransferase involved in cell wall biosynthesis